MPEIVHSYNNIDSDAIFMSKFRAGSDTSKFSSGDFSTSDSEENTNSVNFISSSDEDGENESNKKPPKSSPRKKNIYFDSTPDGLAEYNDESNESDLNEAAVYLAKFLLKVVEKIFAHINPLSRFNGANLFSANLSASAASTLLRDFQINTHRNLNHAQHLLSNYLLFVMYIVNAGSFPKLSYAISSLVNNRNIGKSHKSKGNYLWKFTWTTFF